MVGAAALPLRSEFNIAPATAYLDAANYGPLSRTVMEAGLRALTARAAPWAFDKAMATADMERARECAASLVGASSSDLAVVTSVSHAAAIAASVLPARRGARVLRLAGEHPSNVFPWAGMVARGCVEEVVAAPANGDWTSAILNAIDRPHAPPLAVATFSPYQWTDGARVQLDGVIPAVRRHGGAVFIDATHVAGVESFDVAGNRPDFVAFPLFKWLMGPRGMAFLYVDPSHQIGEPTDRNAGNSQLGPDLEWRSWARGARRYDRGERDDPVSMAIAATALSQLQSWDVRHIATHVRALGLALVNVAGKAGATVLAGELHAPHIIGLRFGAGRAAAVVRGLAARGVIVSERQDVVRVTPHVYNDMSDVEAFSSALTAVLHT